MQAYGVTHPGKVRASNEDAMVWDEAIGFAAVADGMGGHQAGEVAARLALDALHHFLRKSAHDTDFTWPFGINPAWSLTANRLMTGIKIANRRVYKQSEDGTDYIGMGTTIVAVVLEDGRVTFASVGDSRIYMLSGTTLRQLTEDDSWLVMLGKEPGITPEALRAHPMRHVLTNVVGAKPEVTFQVMEEPLAGETLLLTSDGLHNALSMDVMTSVLTRQDDLRVTAEALLNEALERNANDNLTAVLVRP
jgi:serine/threonine protein phosphatase PrpC